jgi:hypothetical protein
VSYVERVLGGGALHSAVAVENYAVEAFIGKSKVESDEILLNCKVRDAIATFGRYVKSSQKQVKIHQIQNRLGALP